MSSTVHRWEGLMLGFFRRALQQPEPRDSATLDEEQYLTLVFAWRDCLRRHGLAPEAIDERCAVWAWWLTRQRLEASEWTR